MNKEQDTLFNRPTVTMREWRKANKPIMCEYSIYPEYDYTDPYETLCWYRCKHCNVGICKEDYRDHEYEICKVRNDHLGYCMLESYNERMYCYHCNTTYLNMQSRKCDRKLMAGLDSPYILFTSYCNAEYIPKFKMWLCTKCGEPHEYSGEPEKCIGNYGPICCEKTYRRTYINGEPYVCEGDNICQHCKTEGANIGLICKIQDRTECECDECMTLYSRFRNNRTKSARK